MRRVSIKLKLTYYTLQSRPDARAGWSKPLRYPKYDRLHQSQASEGRTESVWWSKPAQPSIRSLWEVRISASSESGHTPKPDATRSIRSLLAGIAIRRSSTFFGLYSSSIADLSSRAWRGSSWDAAGGDSESRSSSRIDVERCGMMTTGWEHLEGQEEAEWYCLRHL